MTEILCITHKYPPTIGGMEQQSFELIKGLSNHYKTHVIAYKNVGNKALWFGKLKSRILTVLRENPDIKLIHLNDGSMGVACLWLRKQTNIPVVVTYHGLDITFPLDFFQQKLVPKLSEFAGAVCVSQATRNECLRRGFNEKKTYVVRNGVDSNIADIPFDRGIIKKLRRDFGIDITDKHILMALGRPVKRKGFSWFLKSVMPNLNKNICLLMVGPMKTKYSFFENAWQATPHGINRCIQLMLGSASDAREVGEQLKLQDNVFHLGSLPRPDLLQVLSLADLFIMPNISVPGDIEGFGLVALEASIRGTFVIASGIEGITDAVTDSKNGCLLPSENASVWIDKIHELLSDKEELNTVSKQGKEFTREHYSWEIMVNGYRAVFDRLIDHSSND